MTIDEIKQYFKSLELTNIPDAIKVYKLDSRAGVKKICTQYEKKYNEYLTECNRIQSMREFDDLFGENGKFLLAGVDEAGRGPLAGPVVAAAVILPADIHIEGINDSKQIKEDDRNLIYDEIMKNAVSVGVGIIEPHMIDKINILQATFEAMGLAINNLTSIPNIILVDGDKTIPRLPSSIIQHAVIKGDSKSISIAAASIIAKVTRDRIMAQYHIQYPQYEFDRNKGYGSSSHQEALKQYGPCLIHRQAFIKNIIK